MIQREWKLIAVTLDEVRRFNLRITDEGERTAAMRALDLTRDLLVDEIRFNTRTPTFDRAKFNKLTGL